MLEDNGEYGLNLRKGDDVSVHSKMNPIETSTR